MFYIDSDYKQTDIAGYMGNDNDMGHMVYISISSIYIIIVYKFTIHVTCGSEIINLLHPLSTPN